MWVSRHLALKWFAHEMISRILNCLFSIDFFVKFATGLIYQIGYSSKSIWVTRLLFCQNDSLMGGSFWPKDSLITYIIFELCLIWYISPVANFGTHPLVNDWHSLLWLLWTCNWKTELEMEYFWGYYTS